MKIYTKTGDRGQTALFGAGKVEKDHLRVEAYGAVDELSATVGAALSAAPDGAQWKSALETILNLLFELGAELATPDPSKRMAGIREADIACLESHIDQFEVGLPALTNFVLPGGTPQAASLHLARCVCRRAERRLVSLLREEPDTTEYGLIFLNRLSDLLFVLARVAQNRAQAPEVLWVARPKLAT